MENYMYSGKENYYSQFKETPVRQGDWICVSCNNLNFSFRKKCNRCKVMTKEQNEIESVYSSFYYSEIQYYPEEPVFYSQQKEPLKAQCINITLSSTTPKKDGPLCNTLKNKNSELPSVSPLLRRYRASKKENVTQAVVQSQNKPKNKSSLLNNQNQSCWRALDFDAPIEKESTKDFESNFEQFVVPESENQEDENYEQMSEELEKLVQNIVL